MSIFRGGRAIRIGQTMTAAMEMLRMRDWREEGFSMRGAWVEEGWGSVIDILAGRLVQ